jgi:predicted transglutaminase-like cysteine proteinase
MAKSLFRQAPLGIIAMTAATCLASPASAQSRPAPSVGWSKSEAILGAPSALQAVLAQQNASAPAARPLRPAEFSVPRAVPAILPTGSGFDDGMLSGRPDVFGSVALRVAHTPLDSRWQSVERAAVSGSAERYARSIKSLSPLERLEAVNRYVNRRVHYVEDVRQFGRADVWTSANSTLRHGQGDCEDYAIAKLQMLRRAGISDRDLYLVIVRDLVRRADHAVLVARADGRMLVLDDGTDEILDTARVSDYRPVLTFASYGEWTHGYRVHSTSVEVASAEKLNLALAPAADNQRSRSASLLAFNTGLSK